MNGSLLSLTAALLLGLAASAHCLLMCGGITTALGAATARNRHGRPRLSLVLGYQAGRVTSYAMAGLLSGSIAAGLIAWLDDDYLRTLLRALSAIAMLAAALFISGRYTAASNAAGRLLWPYLAPLGRRLLPVANLPRAFAFGMIWGWMPCGFVYTVVLVAGASLNPWHAASIMAVFGLGTVPALVASSWGSARWLARVDTGSSRRGAAALLVLSAVLTLASPWLGSAASPWLHRLLPYDCAVR